MRRDISDGSSKRTRRFRCSRLPRRLSSRARSARDVALALGLVLATCLVYFIYTPFDDWSYLRFLLPAIALMLVLASAVTVRRGDVARCCPAGSGASASIVAARHRRPRHLLRAHGRRSARVQFEVPRAALSQRGDRRPRSAARECRRAVGVGQRRRALSWAERGAHVGWTRSRVARPQPVMARRARPHAVHPGRVVGRAGVPEPVRELTATIGKLDWPPKYEIDRVVRIFDPKDRAKYDRGENVNTEYLWPLREWNPIAP